MDREGDGLRTTLGSVTPSDEPHLAASARHSTAPGPPGPILFLHGLEGRPDGAKGSALAAGFDVRAPTLDTSAARALAQRHGLNSLTAVRDRLPDSASAVSTALATPLEQARQALVLEPSPSLVVGSSFGGALLLELVHRGLWSGPCLFLAQAGRALLPPDRWLPERLPALLVHGTADDVVPIEGSRELFSRAGRDSQLWELHEGHPLAAFTASGGLVCAAQALLGRATELQ